jgi:hypothetical protein
MDQRLLNHPHVTSSWQTLSIDRNDPAHDAEAYREFMDAIVAYLAAHSDFDGSLVMQAK